MHVNNTKRSPQHISNCCLSQLTIWKCVCVWVLALFTFWRYFIQTAQHNVLVTHSGIRKLHSNTPRISFPPLDILLGRALLGRAARLSRQSEELTRWRGERRHSTEILTCMSLTLIINYGCFCFFLPQPLTTQLLAVRERARDKEREREKAIFIRKN